MERLLALGFDITVYRRQDYSQDILPQRISYFLETTTKQTSSIKAHANCYHQCINRKWHLSSRLVPLNTSRVFGIQLKLYSSTSWLSGTERHIHVGHEIHCHNRSLCCRNVGFNKKIVITSNKGNRNSRPSRPGPRTMNKPQYRFPWHIAQGGTEGTITIWDDCLSFSANPVGLSWKAKHVFSEIVQTVWPPYDLRSHTEYHRSI